MGALPVPAERRVATWLDGCLPNVRQRRHGFTGGHAAAAAIEGGVHCGLLGGSPDTPRRPHPTARAGWVFSSRVSYVQAWNTPARRCSCSQRQPVPSPLNGVVAEASLLCRGRERACGKAIFDSAGMEKQWCGAMERASQGMPLLCLNPRNSGAPRRPQATVRQ